MTAQDIRNKQEQVLAHAAEKPSELFGLLDYIFEHKGFFYSLSCSLKVLFVKKLQEGRVTIEEAAEDAGMTVEEFKKVMENTSLQAV